MICSFFGHRKVNENIYRDLEEEIRSIIIYTNEEIVFYVGNKGSFDFIVQIILKNMIGEYPGIKAYVVLDGLPNEREKDLPLETIVPEGIEEIPKRFAMSFRNKWMIEKCDIAIVFCTDCASNTRKHIDMLKKKRKAIINIADVLPYI